MKRAAGAIVPPFAELAGSDGSPLFRQIYTRLRDAVLDGTLPGGHRLPSARTLAGDLGVSRNTVEAAFSQLVAEGFVTRRVGAGSYVAHAVPEPERRPRRPRAAPNGTPRAAAAAPPPAL
ncbi:MAG: GntR family transcriptional regulator, partial [Gemmatimonadaceae bacterium]